MGIWKRTLICLHLGLLELASVSPALAADQATPQSYPWPWWGELHWHGFAWIFPLACFAMMIVVLLFMIRRGGMGCMSHGRSTDKYASRDVTKRSWNGQSASAVEILNERYARGEIDRQEYDEKKSAIASSR
jgi:uncharacterized membrane protein